MAVKLGNDAWQVGQYTVNAKNPIGKGSYGIIYTATNANGETIVAKRIARMDSSKMERIRAGLENLTQLNHPNILKIYDVVDEGNLIWIFMEYCPEGDLKTFWGKSSQNREQQFNIMIQIAEGLEYLHDNNVIHRDIKPGNILVASSDPLVIKLTDFDLSKFLGDDYETSDMSSNVGTAAYKAPELSLRTSERKISYHRSADIFSLGLTYLAMIQGNKYLIPRLETALYESEKYGPIGSTLASRFCYGIQPVTVVRMDVDSSPPAGEDENGTEEQKYNIKYLIEKMTNITATGRPKITEVLRQLQDIKGKPSEVRLFLIKVFRNS